MSLTPLALQNHFTMIRPKYQPDAARRGRQFESALLRLTEWWYNEFEVENDVSKNVRSRTFNEVQQELRLKGIFPSPLPETMGFPRLPTASQPSPGDSIKINGKGKGKAVENEDNDADMGGEPIRSSKSLMKHALMMRGTRDTSAQLFTALCRALGIPARLVISLQAVPWKSSVGNKSSTGRKLSKDAKRNEGGLVQAGRMTEESDDMEAIVTAPGMTSSKEKGKEKESFKHSKTPASGNFLGEGKAPGGSKSVMGPGRRELERVVRLRRPKPMGQRLGSGQDCEFITTEALKSGALFLV
jgi:xeroderma pigmentosum group C-complementing protein